MALDANIILSGVSPDVFRSYSEGKKEKQDNILKNQSIASNQQSLERQKFQSLNEREQQRIKNVATGALELNSFLQNNDIEGAKNYLTGRKARIEQAREFDPSLDSKTTDQAMRELESNPEKLRQNSQSMVQFGERLGIIRQRDQARGDALSPKAFQQKLALRQAGRPQTNVRVGEGISEELKQLAKNRANRFNEIATQAQAAAEQNDSLERLKGMTVETGFGQDAKATIASIANSFGLDGTAITGVDPANVQAFNAVTGKLVLDIMASQKGPQTDRDQQRIAKTLPLISNEKMANEFNIQSLQSLNDRKVEMAEFYEDFLEKKGTLKGVSKEWNQFKREIPLISEDVEDADTGLPLFYHTFKRKFLDRNRNASEEDIRSQWMKLNE